MEKLVINRYQTMIFSALLTDYFLTSNIPNPDLTFESINEKTNYGVDFTLFRNFNVNFDYYIKEL